MNSTIDPVLTAHEDAIFENATFEEWQQIMGPKVRGAWNLHELFPNLDFFISLSSAVGITGKAGSSLYAGTSVSFHGHLYRGLGADTSWRHSSAHSQNTVSS